MPPSDAQRRAHRKHEATRQRVAIWLDPKTAKRVDRACERLGLASRAEFVELALAREQCLAKAPAAE